MEPFYKAIKLLTREQRFERIRAVMEIKKALPCFRYDVSFHYYNEKKDYCIEHFYALTLTEKKELLQTVKRYRIEIDKITTDKKQISGRLF